MTLARPPASQTARRLDGYEPVARAIDYLVSHWEDRPGLEETAEIAGLSPQHFQRVFKEGAGVSPKRFLQAMAAGEAKRAFDEGASVLDAAFAAGLSGPSRLHDLFLVSEAMTPGAYRRKGEGETIRFAEADGPFGRALIGATEKGICWLSFVEPLGLKRSLEEMKADWPAASFVEDRGFILPLAEQAFAFASGQPLDRPLGLFVQGTNFQLKVWQALLDLGSRGATSYGALADAIGSPGASRAVGQAVGANPVAWLIPCHRVLRRDGDLGGYHWGVERKRAMLAWEMAAANRG